MSDLKKMSMSELITKHNELASLLGIGGETEFKNLQAARAAVETLEKKMEAAQNPDLPVDGATPVAQGATPAPAGDTSKYSSTGKRGPNQGVGAFAKELIKKGLANAAVLAEVKTKFPDAKTTTGCIAFYRTALTKAGAKPAPTAEDLRKQAQEILAKADAAEVAEKAAAQALADKAAAEAQAPTEPTAQ